MVLEGLSGVRPPGYEGPKGPRDRRTPPPESPATSSSDRVQLSDSARLLARVLSMPDIREAKVEEVRDQILRGTYVTEGKLDAALDNLVNEFLEGL